MTDGEDRDGDVVEQYLQLDESARKSLFKAFCRSIRQRMRSGDGQSANAAVRRAVTHYADYSSLIRLGALIEASRCPDEACLRVAVLGGPTLSQFAELLNAFLAGAGIPARVFAGGYRMAAMELLAPAPALDAFAPQVVVLALDEGDFGIPFMQSWTEAEMLEAADREAASLNALWNVVSTRWNPVVVQNLFDAEPWPIFGNHEYRHGVSRRLYAAAVNAAMRKTAPAAVLFHDLPELVRLSGAAAWYDPRFYNEAKMPCSPERLPAYAHSVASVIAASRGLSRKMLVLDLDNTLWGGVVGSSGPHGIVVGQGSGEGEAYLRFQRYAKELGRRGVILGVCSKNDAARAREPFEKNPNMLLRMDDFASFKAGWGDKAGSLREIAREVNIGLDSLVFVDDNPAERALVRMLAPRVAVPDMPDDPSLYIQALAGYRYFESVAVTGEDAERAVYYAENRKRREIEEGSKTLDDFLRSLGMRALVEPVCDANVERAAQLVGRSNQFNLTGVRRGRGELAELSADPEWRTLTVRLRDRCGDNGLIAVILMHIRGSALVVESWVMSCRVLRRGVENFILARIIDTAKQAGCDSIEGIYRKTAKNGMVENLYPDLGFVDGEADGSGTVWRAATLSPGLKTDSHISEE